jgi:catechol 2,3-dioxygenase-like lactoylglutathione lyase family enzyme
MTAPARQNDPGEEVTGAKGGRLMPLVGIGQTVWCGMPSITMATSSAYVEKGRAMASLRVRSQPCEADPGVPGDTTSDLTGAIGPLRGDRPTNPIHGGLEVHMSTTDVGSAPSTETPELSTIDMGLEVVTVPVSDVDRAKRFYQSLGWRLDIDLDGGDVRLVQMTPPHSQCSIHFGKGITPAEPGSLDRLMLAVKDIDAAREDLVSRGVDVSEVEEQPKPPGFDEVAAALAPQAPAPGDALGRSYFAYASFSDPDGNGWLLQEVTTRLPGREWER